MPIQSLIDYNNMYIYKPIYFCA